MNFSMKSVRSSERNPSYSLWAERMAVGSGHTWYPMYERIGMATVREALPYPDKSCIAAIFFILLAFCASKVIVLCRKIKWKNIQSSFLKGGVCRKMIKIRQIVLFLMGCVL